jgi:hypothetical protein
MLSSKNNRQSKSLALWAACIAVFILALTAAPGYAFAQTTSLSFPVQQFFSTASGTVPNDSFNYIFERVGSSESQVLPIADHPMPEGTVGNVFHFSLNGDQRVVLDLEFSRAGFYLYEVRAGENNHGADYRLDDTIYYITISVANNDSGGLDASIARFQTREGEGAELSGKLPTEDAQIVFHKAYLGEQGLPAATDPSLMADPPVRKTVQGNPANAYTFTFRLEAANPDQPMPAGAREGIKDLQIVGSGSAEFGTWSYSEEGTFIYTVREIFSDNRDYVFDPVVYTITDRVVNRDGQLVLLRRVENQSGAEVSSLIFINTFIGDDGEIQNIPPVGSPGAGTRPTPGPKTGDYDDPLQMIVALAVGVSVAAFALVLIYLDRRSEEDYGDAALC